MKFAKHIFQPTLDLQQHTHYIYPSICSFRFNEPLFFSLFPHNLFLLFTLHPNHSPHSILPSQYCPYNSPSLPLPFLLKEGEGPLGYHLIMELLVSARLSTFSPTDAHAGSPGKGRGIQWLASKSETSPAPIARKPI